ncbi:peptidase domain-containing ABC transporter [Microbispora sp. CA-135349]|uniref:peptidase domain-containing ABC transporter n=1 Tax=Microbispora sp. CA-135349 TaxID=3239953 RepID=UPI003D8B4D15
MTRVRRVREVQQFTEAECGLCCAAMVLTAYGSRDCISQLRRRYEVGRDGLTLGEVASILRDHGMRVRFFRATVNRLGGLALPLIAYCYDSHLVVVETVGEKSVTVVDPTAGRRKYSIEEFEEIYSGLVIEATPGASYTPVRDREPSVWREFLRAGGREARPLAGVFTMSLLLYAFTLLLPIATQFAVNEYAGLFQGRPLALVILMLTVSMVAYFAVSLVRSLCLAQAIRNLGEVMMGRTFKTLLGLPYKYFSGRSQGELMYRLSSITSVRDLISGEVSTVLLDVGSLIAAFTYIFFRSASLGFAALGVFLCMFVLALVTYRPIRNTTDREIGETVKSTSMQLEALSSIELLKVSGMTDAFFKEWESTYAGALNQTRRRIVLQGAVSSGYALLQMFGPLFVLLAGLWLVLSGGLDLGSAIAVQTLTATSLGRVASLSSAFTQMITVNAQVYRLGDIVNQPASRDTFGDRQAGIEGAISLREVSFTYPGGKVPALEGVSMDVRPGQRVAIVGSSGSGKSTLGKLLLGLYPVQAGDIAYDGIPLRDLSPDSLYRSVSYVPQEIVLSNRSIAENIKFGNGDIDMEAVREAARQAHIDREIEAMPLGYFTQIRQLGGNLSGGQRQRIALARALARRPRVLVLDEATSALDTVTESLIANALDGLKCTRVIIAHRLSTIMSADLIVVLEQGRVVQTGRHEELLSVPGVYRDLVRSQVAVSGAYSREMSAYAEHDQAMS